MKKTEIDKLLNETKLSFSRSGGKGGQNVNKVETKAELVFNVVNSMVLDGESKMLLLKKLKNRIDKEGNLRVYSQTERSQLGNRKKAVEKFTLLITKALQKAPERIKTKVPASVKLKRLDKKRKKSEKKKIRGDKVYIDE